MKTFLLVALFCVSHFVFAQSSTFYKEVDKQFIDKLAEKQLQYTVRPVAQKTYVEVTGAKNTIALARAYYNCTREQLLDRLTLPKTASDQQIVSQLKSSKFIFSEETDNSTVAQIKQAKQEMATASDIRDARSVLDSLNRSKAVNKPTQKPVRKYYSVKLADTVVYVAGIKTTGFKLYGSEADVKKLLNSGLVRTGGEPNSFPLKFDLLQVVIKNPTPPCGGKTPCLWIPSSATYARMVDALMKHPPDSDCKIESLCLSNDGLELTVSCKAVSISVSTSGSVKLTVMGDDGSSTVDMNK